jgi:dTDP-4-amino-4,6-dideoxygalactose transaminase
MGPDCFGSPTFEGYARVDRQGHGHLVTVSGRAAILLALRALGIGPGDRVLVPTYHCPTMIEPVVHIGATPLFYPIDAAGDADFGALQSQDVALAKAVLVAHFFGLPKDLRPVRDWCHARGLALIEDCAHAYFGHSAQGPVGSIGDLAIASVPKFFAAVEGGCLIARKPELLLPPLNAPRALHELRTIWDCMELSARAGRLGIGTAVMRALMQLKGRLRGHWKRNAGDIGGGSQGDDESPFKTISSVRANQRASWFTRRVIDGTNAQRLVTARRANYLRFAAHFDAVAGLRPLFAQLPDGAVPYVFPLWVDQPSPLYATLRARGVPLYRWDVRWPGTPDIANDAAAVWSSGIFQLVCHQDMTSEDIDRVAAVVREEAIRCRR